MKRFMRSKNMIQFINRTSLIVFVLCIGGCSFSSYLSWTSKEYNRKGEAALVELVKLLDEKKNETGSYPESLVLLQGYSEVESKYLTGPHAPKFSYYLDNNDFRIYYYQQPAGPFHGYDSDVMRFEYHK